jgi:hypothetical protein
MKRTNESIINELDGMSVDELRQHAFAYLRIKEHIWREFEKSVSENRIREKLRLKIAQKHISFWFNEYKKCNTTSNK